VVAVATLPLWLLAPARADCASPELSVSPAQVEVGDEITVTGEYWNDVCNDTSMSVGCVSVDSEEDQPSQNIQLYLLDRDTRERFELGVVDADDNFGFELTTTADVPPGWYVVKDQKGQSYVSTGARFRVVPSGT
jgi:hypothetical protein